MGYNIRSITSFFFHLASSFSAFLVSFSIRHLKTLDILQLSGVQAHSFQIGVFHMIYIINVKVWIDHIFQRISGVFSPFSFVHRLAISFIGHFVGEILWRIRVIPVIHRGHWRSAGKRGRVSAERSARRDGRKTNADRRRQWPSLNCLHPKSDGPHFGLRGKMAICSGYRIFPPGPGGRL